MSRQMHGFYAAKQGNDTGSDSTPGMGCFETLAARRSALAVPADPFSLADLLVPGGVVTAKHVLAQVWRTRI
jgi:hypothetical protein